MTIGRGADRHGPLDLDAASREPLRGRQSHRNTSLIQSSNTVTTFLFRQFGTPQKQGHRLLREEDEMQFHGIDLDHAWRIAFWVILVLAALGSAAHAIFA